MARSPSGESVLTRAVRILDAFTPDEPALPVSVIARRSGLPVATASRLIAELVGHGLLAREPDRRIRVGVRLWELGQRASPTLGLREAAMPFLADLHDVVGHHIQLGVLEGDEVLFVERLSAPGAVINYTRIAGRLPLHASSSGLVLLAHSPGELQERVLAAPLARYTANTITDPGRLRGTLAGIRRDGYVLCAGHIHPEATGIAVPVRSDTQVVAAVAAIVPNDEHARAAVPALRAAARGIGRLLSH
ncbi:MAG TPA: IclR family transcriptional regulator [Pseudonocardia sp.]|jgi:DNA-binding IclR family transcriptional regulator|nr:IclR family transcriptional regulator [Pseudonocardia sp.]